MILVGRKEEDSAKPLCKFISQPKGCHRGENCQFRHSDPIVETPVCKYFNTSKGCKLGDQCTFSHSHPRDGKQINLIYL